MILDCDIYDYPSVYEAIEAAPKGVDFPFCLAGSWNLTQDQRNRLKRAMIMRTRRNHYPYDLHWMASYAEKQPMVGYWTRKKDEDITTQLHRTAIDMAAEHGIHREVKIHE